ncbi:MAG: c-type cytochrome [Candidatus Omnitrophica bacterium]|nr:c-type cytochrome [Candidatus Omnitrophota bacterium]
MYKRISQILSIAFIALNMVPAVLAADGADVYRNHCARCHGDTGMGDGPASTMQRPRPRDFTSGEYKFKTTPDDQLPAVDDVAALVSNGNLRSSMPPFKNLLTKEEISAVSAYVLEFSKENVPAEPQVYEKKSQLNLPGLKPGAEAESLYLQNCASCHGNDGRGLGVLAPALKDKDGYWLMLPDLTDAKAYGGGSEAADIAMRIRTGIVMSNMPAFEEILSPDEIDQIALYVRSLQQDLSQRRPVDAEVWRKNLPAEVRGEYMVRAMSCALCHNSYDETGMYYPDMYLAGGVAITLPGLGVFYTKNITSHLEDGVGSWSHEDIVKTITTGYAPDRRLEAFSMPWTFFSNLTDGDAADVAAYIQSLPAIANKVPVRKYDSFPKRLWSRLRQLFRLEYGRLEYPPFNQGTAIPEKEKARHELNEVLNA